MTKLNAKMLFFLCFIGMVAFLCSNLSCQICRSENYSVHDSIFNEAKILYDFQSVPQNIVSRDAQQSLPDKQILPNFHKVTDMLYRGGRPRQQGIKELQKIGVKTILDFESSFFRKDTDEVKKEKQWAEQAGLKFLHIPMHPLFRPSIENIQKALKFITSPENQPIFIHCERGSDRTGIVIAAYRIKFQGWKLKDAYEEMKQYGHRNVILFWWKNVLSSFQQEKNLKEANP